MFQMSNEQQEKVFNNFKKVIDKRNADLVNKDLYYHLNLNCNFVAYFNLKGFRENYSGENFREFVEKFDPNSPASEWASAPEISAQFDSLNHAMLNYVEGKAPEIYNSIH